MIYRFSVQYLNSSVMKKHYFTRKILQVCLLFFITLSTNVFAQVGIGTTSPHASSVLDVSSTTQGMLTPRMTTAQRAAITSPADGLMVYDLDLKSIFHYNSGTALWSKMSSDANGRLKFKRIKSSDVLSTVLADELAAGGTTKYLLNSETLYEINGQVLLDKPIELNNAYVTGLDSGEDKLVVSSGDLFTGSTGGSIRGLTLVSGGNVFNIVASTTQNLILRDGIIANSGNVGLIKGFSLVFVSIIQFVGNTNGIIYEDVDELLINNVGWFDSNFGTYEKLKGSFELIAKQGGFSEVNGAAIGFDVSSDPAVSGDAVMESVVFTGNFPAGYVKPYTSSSNTGYNFTNNWNVRCAGIPTEGDSFATGSIYHNRATSPTTTVPIFATVSNGIKLNTNTSLTFTNLFRTSIGSPAQNNRITYLGKKSRIFQVSGAVAFDTSTSVASEYVFYIMKVGSTGTLIPQIGSETYIDANAGYIQAFPVQGTVQLDINESVEIWVKRANSGTTNVVLKTMSLSIK